MMRYAEVILNLAEAYAREKSGWRCMTYLNVVRDRSLADPTTQSYKASDFADNKELLNAVLIERRIELAMEGRRFPDIHRLQHCPYFPIAGVPGKVQTGFAPAEEFELFDASGNLKGPYSGELLYAIPYDSHLFLWPIPQDEINANPKLAEQQNPGY